MIEMQWIPAPDPPEAQVLGCTCRGVGLPVSKEALMALLLTTFSLGTATSWVAVVKSWCLIKL